MTKVDGRYHLRYLSKPKRMEKYSTNQGTSWDTNHSLNKLQESRL